MKKLVFLFVSVVLTTISANVFAQGTGKAPALGSTHTYKINGGVAVSGNSYSWSLDKGTLGTPAANSDYDFGAVTNEPSIDITWLATTTLSTNYYLRVVETVIATGCSNEKVIKIVPVNPFYLAISTAQTSPVCYADPVEVTLASTEPQYNHGTVDMIYTVTPNNIGSGTSYSFSIAELLSNTTNFTTSPSVSGGNLLNGVVTSTGTGAVTLTFTVTNDVFFTNTTDANGSAADISLNIAISNGKTNQDVTDNGNGTKNVTVNASRPNTGEITTD